MFWFVLLLGNRVFCHSVQFVYVGETIEGLWANVFFRLLCWVVGPPTVRFNQMKPFKSLQVNWKKNPHRFVTKREFSVSTLECIVVELQLNDNLKIIWNYMFIISLLCLKGDTLLKQLYYTYNVTTGLSGCYDVVTPLYRCSILLNCIECLYCYCTSTTKLKVLSSINK